MKLRSVAVMELFRFHSMVKRFKLEIYLGILQAVLNGNEMFNVEHLL